MATEFEIAYPNHGIIERIEVPDDYVNHFDGEIKCGATGQSTKLRIYVEIGRAKVLKVESR